MSSKRHFVILHRATAVDVAMKEINDSLHDLSEDVDHINNIVDIKFSSSDWGGNPATAMATMIIYTRRRRPN